MFCACYRLKKKIITKANKKISWGSIGVTQNIKRNLLMPYLAQKY